MKIPCENLDKTLHVTNLYGIKYLKINMFYLFKNNNLNF
jgi:hypothetical protein